MWLIKALRLKNHGQGAQAEQMAQPNKTNLRRRLKSARRELTSAMIRILCAPLGARSSAGEHYVHTVGVTGSIPVAPTIKINDLSCRPPLWRRFEPQHSYHFGSQWPPKQARGMRPPTPETPPQNAKKHGDSTSDKYSFCVRYSEKPIKRGKRAFARRREHGEGHVTLRCLRRVDINALDPAENTVLGFLFHSSAAPSKQRRSGCSPPHASTQMLC